MKYAIVTFGCRVNQADSLRLEEDLCRAGGIAAAPSEADLVIVNSCSVTATADQGTRQAIRRIARTNPGASIVVTGCYATRRPHELAGLPGVVRVVRNDDKLRLLPLLEDSGALVTTAERFGGGDGACGSVLTPGIAGRTACTLRVQTGCEQPCSYCIIPSTRGSARSTPLGAVVAEVERMASAGFREIVLAGVHLGSYGRDLDPRRSLMDLLCALAAVDADVMFRISSLEPMDCTREIVDLVAQSSGRFAPHFHLPLQHASDTVLRRMRRPYTFEHYRRLVEYIVERLPHASIGTDMIAGFPGETDDDFHGSLAYLSSSPLSHVHVFPYSDRPGTGASGMDDKVAGPTVRARGAAMRAAGAELARRFRRAHVGSVRPGLTLDDGMVVLTDNYLKVRIGERRRRNERVRVRLDTEDSGTVVGGAFTPASQGPAAAPGRSPGTIR